ncbi:unnamed protein product, partial [Mesorhabditis spiculigera]
MLSTVELQAEMPVHPQMFSKRMARLEMNIRNIARMGLSRNVFALSDTAEKAYNRALQRSAKIVQGLEAMYASLPKEALECPLAAGRPDYSLPAVLQLAVYTEGPEQFNQNIVKAVSRAAALDEKMARVVEFSWRDPALRSQLCKINDEHVHLLADSLCFAQTIEVINMSNVPSVHSLPLAPIRR